MWLAGFCIYEANRFPFFNRDRAYLILVSGALICSILSAATAALFRVYLFAHATADARASLARRGTWVVRACFRYYISGIMLYLLSLTRVGYQYYPDTGSMPAAFRLVPTVTAGCTAVAFVRVYRVVVARFLAVERAPPAPAAAKGDSKDSKSPLADYMHAQGGEIATLALFVANFAQAGVTRFAVGADGGNVGASALYLVATCVAFAMAAFAVFASSVLLVFLYDLEGAARKEAFAAACEPIYRAVQATSLVALLAFNCSFATVGWGCGHPGLTFVPAVLGYASLLVLCFVALLLLHAALRDETESAAMATKYKADASVGGLEAHVSTLAVRSSIASGFVYYHLITFRTDVGDVETVYGQAFLVVHCCSFALGITACIAAHVTWIALTCAYHKARMARCAAYLVGIIGRLFWCSLACFVAGFGLIGSVKHSVPVTTAAISAVSLTAFVVAALAIARPWRRRAAGGGGGGGGGRLQRWQTTQQPHDEVANRLSDQAFFFGSFGYYAVLFLNAGGGVAGWILVAYSTCMGSSFAVGLTMVALTLVTHGAPPSRALRQLFVGLHHFAVVAFFLGFAAIGIIKTWEVRRQDGGGFAPDPRGASVYAFIIAGGGVTLIVCAGAAHLYVKRRLRQPSGSTPAAAATSSAPSPLLKRKFSFSGEQGLLAVRRLELSKEQLAAAVKQASFCAGNVFFDILFCTTAPTSTLNVWYFSAATATFCLCAFVISAASDALLAVPAAPRPAEADAVHTLSRVAVGLLLLSQGAWLLAVAAAGVLKDPERAAAVSLTGGGAGLLLMALHYVQIRTVSASVDDEDDGGDRGLARRGSALARVCCRAAVAWTDLIATHRLWWRAGALYVAVVFMWEALEGWGAAGSFVRVEL